jgi:enoyl-CoA hydratase/carnithine racemase
MGQDASGTTNEAKVTTEVRGHLLLIGLNRANKKNAFDLEMLMALSTALTRLDDDDALRVGVVFPHGRDFTAGLDLMSVAPTLSGGQHIFSESVLDPWGTHGRACRKPVVVAVRGLCLTLGIELILNTEICVAADDTRFAQIEVKRGIFPFGGGTARWVERVGWGNAMRWLLTADELDAREALRIGLVQEVVAPDAAVPRAIELAERIAAQAPLGIAATLRSARLAVTEGVDASFRELLPELRRLMASEDAQEGLASFVERRAGRFTGR